jgi:hypothetical protein
MMQRIAPSEARRPGMASTRHCGCGALLTASDGEQCIECRPRLSAQARTVSVQRRQELHEIEQADWAVENLELLLRRLVRKAERTDDGINNRSDKRHR